MPKSSKESDEKAAKKVKEVYKKSVALQLSRTEQMANRGAKSGGILNFLAGALFVWAFAIEINMLDVEILRAMKSLKKLLEDSKKSSDGADKEEGKKVQKTIHEINKELLQLNDRMGDLLKQSQPYMQEINKELNRKI